MTGSGQRPVIAISGAASGAGCACAFRLAMAGAELVLCDNDGPGLRAVADATGAFARFCDIASEASVEIFAREILASYPHIHAVINAAGRGYVRSLGMMRLSNALMPSLKRPGSARTVVNIASRARFPTEAGLFPYGGSDSAFMRLSEAIALQFRGVETETVTLLRGPVRDPDYRDVQPPKCAARVIPIGAATPDAVAGIVHDIISKSLFAERDVPRLRRAC